MTAIEAGPGRRARITAAWRSGPLSAPAFRLLTAGQFTSTIGDYCYAVALPWLILSNHGGADQLGAVLACYGIPRAALTVPGGSLADRFGPRRVMLGSDAARCGLTAVFAVFAARHVSSLAAIAPVAAVLGGCSAVFLPASYAIMPSLLSAERLPGANAVYAGVLQVGSLLGPVIGGVAVVASGPAAAFGADAASYAVSAVSLALIGTTAFRHVPEEPAASMASPEPATASASVWGLLLRARILQIILVVSVTANFALTGSTEVALPALAHARFGAGGYGALLTCVAVGSLAGTLIVARVGGRVRPAMSLGAVFLVAAVAVGLTPFLGGLPGAAGAMLVFGIAVGFDGVLSVTLLQQWAPPGMVGRVMGLVMLASVGSFPLSAAIAGVLTRHLGPSPVFPIAGALLAAAVLAALAQREFRDFGTQVQSDTSDEPASDPAAPSAP